MIAKQTPSKTKNPNNGYRKEKTFGDSNQKRVLKIKNGKSTKKKLIKEMIYR